VSKVISSAIVEVNFEINEPNITFPKVQVPVAYPEYIRYPIKVGDRGMTVPADVWLGNITGTGATTPPDLTRPQNLAALAFIWLGNKNWSATDDPNALVLYAPNGVILRDTNSNTKIVLTPSGITITPGGDITINNGSHNVTITGSGNVTVTGSGDIKAGTISLLNHVHSGVTTGSGNTGVPH
jgi:hypothetical protein